MTYTVFALIQNKPSVLAQMTAILSDRDVSVETLTLGASEQSGLSRITMTARGAEQDMQEVIHQLGGLRDVVSLRNISEEQMNSYVASQLHGSYI